jgi:ribosomal protein S27E
MVVDKLRVIDCHLCSLFKEFPEDTKLYYPKDKESIPNSEFIIIECKDCKSPVVIYGEHVSEITKEAYGRILYKCRMLFGNDVIIKSGHRIVEDHWSHHKIGKF